jgi:Ni,Fe-hydrogenase I large subunit
MPEVHLPIAINKATVGNPPPPGTTRIVIDPLTRIEGHLRIEATITNGKVADAWSASTMFRGLEKILIGRDPRDAWFYTQRVCGVCTTVHALASVRAVENALGITIPDNARLIRNLLCGAQFLQDHVVHFYHLHALDWVDVVSALSANPTTTSNLQKSISAWGNNSAAYFTSVRDRLQTFVNSGQLGLFANGYWGHPAYKLSPEANLLAVAHYLEALDVESKFIQFHALLGGKNPHPQTYLVGGTATVINPAASGNAINAARIATMRSLLTEVTKFITQVYVPDVKLVASQYPSWATLGDSAGNFLAFGEFPLDNTPGPGSYYLPQGVVLNRDLSHPAQAVNQALINEYVTHSWYSYTGGDSAGLHPTLGQTSPNYTGPNPPYDHLDTNSKYSWLKAPRYNGQAMEVGPLARMAVAYANGHTRARALIDGLLSALGLPASALFSALGRVAARAVETQMIAEQMTGWITALETNMNANNLTIHDGSKWDPSTWPAQASGWATTEAPRGALGHWVSFANGKITNYQLVVPTTWNGSPRDASGQRGPFEQSLIGLPVADPAKPVEILRVIHSFDPCMACAVHLTDARGVEIGGGVTGIQVGLA